MGATGKVLQLGAEAALGAGKQFFKKMKAAKTLPKLSGIVTEDLTKHIDTLKPEDYAAEIGSIETMFKGMVNGNDASWSAFDEFSSTTMVANQYQKNVGDYERIVNSQYTRPDAIESLGKLGSQTKWGRIKRTIQGPVPPNLSDKTFAQGATTPEEAIMAPSGGTTKFIPKSKDPFQIRNYAAAYSPKGQTTKIGTRKTTGRGITKEGNTRKINEELATDPNITPEERKEFARIMAEAAAKGMDGDHIIEVSRVANAVRDMSPERRAAYFEVMRRTNTPTGNHPKNIQILSKEMNQVVKPAEIRALDNALRKMDKRGKSLLEELLDI